MSFLDVTIRHSASSTELFEPFHCFRRIPLDRRSFTLLGLSFGLSLIPATSIADGHGGPIAIAGIGEGRERRVFRLYAGRGDTPFILLERSSEGDAWYGVETDGNASQTATDLSRGGNLTVEASNQRIPISLAAVGQGQRQEFTIDGRFTGSAVSTNAFVLLLVLQLVAIAVAILNAGILVGSYYSAYVTALDGQRIRAGIRSLDASGQNGGGNVIADPACDGPPIRLC